MTDPQLGVLMLVLFVVFILFGFPIAFTLMAMGVGFAFAALVETSTRYATAGSAHMVGDDQ